MRIWTDRPASQSDFAWRVWLLAAERHRLRTPRNHVSRATVSASGGSIDSTMLCGIQSTLITQRDSTSSDVSSLRMAPLSIPSESRPFNLRMRLANAKPGFGVSGGDCRIHAC